MQVPLRAFPRQLGLSCSCGRRQGTGHALARLENARLVIEAAIHAGAQERALFETAQVSSDLLEDSGELIDYRHVSALWEAASCLTQDPVLGLHAGEESQLATFGLVGFAIRSCENGRQAFELGTAWATRYIPDTDYEWVIEDDVCHFRHRLRNGERENRHGIDYLLAAFVCASRSFLRLDWRPVEVGFQYPQLADISEHERIFQSPLRFDAEWNVVSFDAQLLDAPLFHADPELLDALEPHVEKFLKHRPSAPSLAARVREYVSGQLDGGDPGLEATSRAIGMPSRTLQRRLRELGTTHSELLDALRSDRAKSQLLDPKLSLAQIAGALGFTDVSAFSRAFRRWTGKSPRAFRDARSPSPN